MNSKVNFYQLFANNCKIFKRQDSQDDHFDVCFQIGEKKLYANKLILSSVSTTFKSMLSDRWRKTDDPIAVTDYNFDDFKKFLTFIYSGKCALTNDNIFAIVDMAEFYGITVLKNECEEFLTKMKLNLDNVCKMLEFADKYSLIQFKKCLHQVILGDIPSFLQSARFNDYQESFVIKIVEFNQENFRQEEIAETISKWAKKQAKEKPQLKETLQELSDTIQLFKFDTPKYLSFIQFVVENSLLFSGFELGNILYARTKIYAKITDENGKIMKGELECENAESVAAVIQSIKNGTIGYWGYIYFEAGQPKPTTPSKLKKKKSVKWYLVYNEEGDIAIKCRDQLCVDDYLLAKMFPEKGFQLSFDCKIVVVSCL